MSQVAAVVVVTQQLPQTTPQVLRVVEDLLVAVVVLPSTQEFHQQELQQAVLAELAICIQVAQAQVVQLIPVAQVEAVLAIAVMAVTHQVTQAEQAETAEAEAVALTTLEHQALAVTAYFIFTTKEN